MILVLAEAARNINIAAVRMRKHPNLEYIIVLGAHVEGTRLTKALLERTRRALQYMEENPETKAVLSGGKGRRIYHRSSGNVQLSCGTWN